MVVSYSGFRTVFTRKRFEDIKHFIHFSDLYDVIPGRSSPDYDPLYKIVLLLIIYRRNLKVYKLQSHRFLLTIPWYLLKADSESNSLFPTNLSVSVSNCGNSVSPLLATAINLTCIWEKANKADDPLHLGKSAAVVMNFVKGLEHKNYDVYTDNYYTSVPLFLALADKGIDARANRKFFTKAALVDEVKRQPRGTFAWRANESLPSMLWKDRKSIIFLSSIHQPRKENQLNAK